MNYEQLIDMHEAIGVCRNAYTPADERRDYHFKVHIQGIKDTVLPLINEELDGKLPEWTNLRNIHDSLVCVHTLNVLYCISKDNEY